MQMKVIAMTANTEEVDIHTMVDLPTEEHYLCPVARQVTFTDYYRELYWSVAVAQVS